TLYAAAAFIVCGVPLEDIYMILTPLHSQNFIDMQDGILTNNRRLVTKTMWFNGTEISNKAQRALRNEQVTVVAHNTGCIHCLYDDATIDPKAYERFKSRLANYLSTGVDMTVFASFLRSSPGYQKYFQLCRDCHGQPQFIRAELLYHYEHGSPYKIGDDTHDKLLAEVSDEDFVRFELPGRMRCDRLCEFLKSLKQGIDVWQPDGRDAMKKFVESTIPDADKFVEELRKFVHTEPNLPNNDKTFSNDHVIRISPDWSREEIIDYLRSIRSHNTTADLAFYAFRDMETCDWRPFLKAAVERSPVSLEKTQAMSVDAVYDWLQAMRGDSIYDANRLAQPDEVANYLTGDGLEKAILLANVLRPRSPDRELRIEVDKSRILLRAERDYEFSSAKTLQGQVDISPKGETQVTHS
ncbi:MAG: hypothetical protein ABFE13_25420, partial [Phycisphaerales bacterium]